MVDLALPNQPSLVTGHQSPVNRGQRSEDRKRKISPCGRNDKTRKRRLPEGILGTSRAGKPAATFPMGRKRGIRLIGQIGQIKGGDKPRSY